MPAQYPLRKVLEANSRFAPVVECVKEVQLFLKVTMDVDPQSSAPSRTPDSGKLFGRLCMIMLKILVLGILCGVILVLVWVQK